MTSIKEGGTDVGDQPKQAAGDQGSTISPTQFSVDRPVVRESKLKLPVDCSVDQPKK